MKDGHTCVHMYMCMSLLVCSVCLSVHTCVHACACLPCTCVSAWIHTYMSLYVCVSSHVCIHTCALACVCCILREKCVWAEALRQEDVVGCKDLCAGLGVRDKRMRG